MFATLEPRALPILKPVLPRNAAIADTRISGAEVAIPTTVKPITRGDTPRLRAVAAAPTTKRSAAHANAAKPTITAIAAVSITEYAG